MRSSIPCIMLILLLIATYQYHCQLVLFTKYLTYIVFLGLFTVHVLFYCFYSYVVGIFEQPLAK